jgi:hypothetical protein
MAKNGVRVPPNLLPNGRELNLPVLSNPGR